MVKFLRRTGNRFSKLGKGRKKKQKWRKPTGRDNKMREKRKGYPAVVKIGYKQYVKVRGEIKEKKPMIIMNVKDLWKIKKNEIGIIGRVGKKKKIEIAKIAKDKKIEIYNLNAGKFLRKTERKAKVRVKTSEKKVEEKKTEVNEKPKEKVQEKSNTKLEEKKDESKK